MQNIVDNEIGSVCGLGVFGDWLDTATAVSNILNTTGQTTANIIAASKGGSSTATTTTTTTPAVVGGNTSTYAPYTPPTTTTQKTTNYTPWIIGGIVILGLGAMFLMNNNSGKRR